MFAKIRTMKYKLPFLLSVLIIAVIFGFSMKDTDIKVCNAFDSYSAISIVKNLPEVKTYLASEQPKVKDQRSEPTVDIDSETASSFKVHVYSNEQYTDTPDINTHTATFNWYTLDKCTGRIKCSFAEYNKSGGYVKNSDKYPCD